jgi:hypothetical protein
MAKNLPPAVCAAVAGAVAVFCQAKAAELGGAGEAGAAVERAAAETVFCELTPQSYSQPETEAKRFLA